MFTISMPHHIKTMVYLALLGMLLIGLLIYSGLNVTVDNPSLSQPNRLPVLSATPSSDPPKNIILLIGDGMGFEHLAAAGMYANGEAGTFAFESAPYQADMITSAANSAVTDSAAAATAMGTGYKVNNGVISMQIPGDGSELQSSLEYYRDRCKMTGLVTTAHLTHATPASFGAHEPERNLLAEIAHDYLNQTRPHLILGGGENGLSVSDAQAAGYTVVSNRLEMQAIDPMTVTHLSGQFGLYHLAYEYDYFIGNTTFYDTYPHLSEMAQSALDILQHDPDGFFLMVEGGRIDHAAHANNIEQNIFETMEFAHTIQLVLDWAADRDDTLIILTADHETGGLSVIENNGQGHFPTVSWSTGGHTAQNVPVYAWGPNAEMVTDTLDNTHIYGISIANNDDPTDCMPIPTPTPTLTLTPIIILTNTASSSNTPLASPTSTLDSSPTNTPSPTPTTSPSPTPTTSPSPTSTSSPSPTPSSTATNTATLTPSNTPTLTPSILLPSPPPIPLPSPPPIHLFLPLPFPPPPPSRHRL